MSHRLFLPLAIMALLSSAATNLSYAGSTLSSQVIESHCTVSALGTGNGHMPLQIFPGDTPIGSLSDFAGQSMFTAAHLPLLQFSANKKTGPYFIAALEMEGSPLAGQSASRCYPALSLATSSVPSATAGTSYSTVLIAAGGQPPYTWSLGQSSLPSGFSISSSGDLTGTPSSAGSYAFSVIVSDALKNNVIGALSLTVASNTSTQPTPPPTPTPTPSGPATGTALNSCGDITKSGTYYLSQDVSSAGACFGIDAPNVILNLNGHTITYGTGGGSEPTPAIEAHACWSTGNPVINGPCLNGVSHGGMEIYGGTILQSPNSATFSPVFDIGQASNISPAPYVHDITATFQSTGSVFYSSTYVPPGAKIENNIIHDNVTNIDHPGESDYSARSAFQGQAIFISNNANEPGIGDTITGNTITSSPQGGILTNDQHSIISGNDISMNSTYTNDFCVEVESEYTQVTDNKCHPRSGRGVDVAASYVTVENNQISTTELPQNAEYSGCEIGGSYGVRVEAAAQGGSYGDPLPTGVVVKNNTITVAANSCNGMGLDLIYLPTGSTVSVTGNTIKTTNAGKSGVLDAGLQFDDSFGQGITITGNTVTSSNEWVYGDWDGYNSINIGHNTWLGTPKYTVFAGDGACTSPTSNPAIACPVSLTITDALPNTVFCGPFSEAAVTINGQLTQCKGH